MRQTNRQMCQSRRSEGSEEHRARERQDCLAALIAAEKWRGGRTAGFRVRCRTAQTHRRSRPVGNAASISAAGRRAAKRSRSACDTSSGWRLVAPSWSGRASTGRHRAGSIAGADRAPQDPNARSSAIPGNAGRMRPLCARQERLGPRHNDGEFGGTWRTTATTWR